MRRVATDVLVLGDGVLGRSIAFALAGADPGLRVALAGRRAAGASAAAGAMLGVLGEVTAAGLRTRHGRLRLGLAVEAARRWPAWRERVRERAGARAPLRDGYGAGTFVLLNAVSGRLDEQAFAAIGAAGHEHGLPVQEVDPADVPAHRPLENDRALRALHLPAEAYLDARRWLATLDAALAALPGLTRVPAGRLRTDGAGYALHLRGAVLTAPTLVLAAGAWTTPLLEALDPRLPVLPVVAAEGTAVTLGAPAPLPAVLRTPNRAYACGLHAVPQADGSWYVGASTAPALAPGGEPTAGALRFLLEGALGQLHHGLTGARVRRLHHGNRPVGLDGHPLLGATARPGLWIATGTHRDGLHASPLIAEELAAAILHHRPSNWLAPWHPDRSPVTDWTREAAVEEAAVQLAALAAESRMRPPLTGAWPELLVDGYRRQLGEAYDRLPEGLVLPPELAPLAYEQGPELAKLIERYLRGPR
ncbi:glycine/D-amino acid oxidase-like deaminating enzyme [Kitasatospora viridis]|uniref:Glycine/D-amino acid oxidase-like deaminating enzyme n=1 Tax=Kitasatospora viridis TaxID=281105 RepID=A0A561S969_9ACTN|nr:glycine/D-amino acid oxidase-like deaminating enzyme [Kitasatospora viridis]